MRISFRPRQTLLAAALSMLSGLALAADPIVILQGLTDAVTTLDLEAASHRLPLASRQALMSRPDVVQKQAEDLYVRRELAAEARRDGLDRDPIVVALIRQSSERILSEARLVEIDLANLPSAADARKAAREIYDLDPKRWQTPEQFRASHILVARTTDPEADRERAEKLLAELKAGAAFEDLARSQSADTASASRGGDLGWFGPGQMVKEFEEAVRKLDAPGALSDIVETRFGLHLIRLTEKRPGGTRSFEEVEPDLIRQVQAQAQAAARESKLKELLSGARVDADAIAKFASDFSKP